MNRYKRNFVILRVIVLCLVFLLATLESGLAEDPAATEDCDPSANRGDCMPVVYARAAVEAGTALKPEMFTLKWRFRSSLSIRAVTKLEDLNGKFARSLIDPRLPLHKDYLSSTKPSNTVAKVPWDKLPELEDPASTLADVKPSGGTGPPAFYPIRVPEQEQKEVAIIPEAEADEKSSSSGAMSGVDLLACVGLVGLVAGLWGAVRFRRSCAAARIPTTIFWLTTVIGAVSGVIGATFSYHPEPTV